jgi:hypothetical protein
VVFRAQLSRLALAFGSLVALGCDSTSPPRPAALLLVSSPPAEWVAGTNLTGLSVAVRDDKGKDMAGQPLSVSVQGGGTLVGGPTQSTINPTSLGSWTLATKSGPNSLTVTTGSLPPLVINVNGVGGPAARVQATGSTAGVVGAAHAVSITAKDQFDNASSGATLALSTSGGGSVPGSTITTGADGTASVIWTLGQVPGGNSITVASGSAQARLDVMTVADVAASITVISGGGQTAQASTPLLLPITIRAADRFGNFTAGRTVSFAVTAGGGRLGGTSAVTDVNGVAIAPTWTLGNRVVAQRVTATSGTASGELSATVFPGMAVTLRYFGNVSDAHKAVFEGAASRLRAVVVGSSPAVALNNFNATGCGVPGLTTLTETVSGIVIYASILPIDGPGETLAQAGPCIVRAGVTNFGQPIIAVIELDVDDLATLAGGSSLEDVLLHEMFHSIGLGTIWGTRVTATPASDPRYTAVFGLAACRVFAPVACAASVPVENTGGPGTYGGHWRESTFVSELMTGYLNPGTNPLSRMTVESLRDLSYTVNPLAADTYSLPTTALRANAPTLHYGWERVFGLVQANDPVVGVNGGVVAIRRP